MARIILGAVVAFMLVGVANAAGNDRAQIIAAIKERMIDPDSLKVNKITMYPPINGVKGACASINAKNRLGGYTGNQNIIIYNEKGKWRAGSATSILTCEEMQGLHRDHAMSQ